MHSINLYLKQQMQKRTFAKTMSVKSGFFYTILPQSRAGKSVLVGSILHRKLMNQKISLIMKQKISFTFVWNVHDISPFLGTEEVNTILENLEAGLKKLPFEEKFTFDPEDDSSDSKRQHQIASQSEAL